MRPDELCRDLGLRYLDGQDWGFINGSSARLGEFLDYWTRGQLWNDPDVRCGFVDIMISSLNEALLDGTLRENERTQIIEIIAAMYDGCRMHLEHWMSLPHDDEFPVKGLIQDALANR